MLYQDRLRVAARLSVIVKAASALKRSATIDGEAVAWF
jgi:hypothetical protein